MIKFLKNIFIKKPIIFLKKYLWKILRLLFILILIFITSLFIVKELTPSDSIISFKRECNDKICEKKVDPERSVVIKNYIEVLSSNLERFDFFARFTFLRFDFQIINQTQFNFEITQPKYEKGVNVAMQCNFNGQEYIFSPGSGIIFQQKSPIGNIIKELDKIQNILVNCNPATQNVSLTPLGKFPVAPNAQINFIYNEEKYYLKFLPDKWNYIFMVLQIFIITGILLGAYYEILRFVKKGFRE